MCRLSSIIFNMKGKKDFKHKALIFHNKHKYAVNYTVVIVSNPQCISLPSQIQRKQRKEKDNKVKC